MGLKLKEKPALEFMNGVMEEKQNYGRIVSSALGSERSGATIASIVGRARTEHDQHLNELLKRAARAKGLV